jgi:hypothetical protein
MNEHLGSASIQGQYLAKSLPVQIHMHVAEALDRVVGKDYRTSLIEFENAKIKELFEYNKVADNKCIQVAHRKL